MCFQEFVDGDIDGGPALGNKGEQFEHWVVVTTIQGPTRALWQIAKIPGWKLVVVGDRTTPKDWK